MPGHRERAKHGAVERNSTELHTRVDFSVIKEVVFIRHGHSLGQAAGRDRRKVDMALCDADLSPSGVSQVHFLKKQFSEWSVCPELVLSSPLTRALKTALTIFQDHDRIIVHPGLAELNSHRPIPENRGRELRDLLKDDDLVALGLGDRARVNLEILTASSWPHSSGNEEFAIAEFLHSRPERQIVIVSHCNYIKSCLRGVWHGGVDNCAPIHTNLVRHDQGPSLKFVLCEKPHFWCSKLTKDDREESQLR